MSQRPTVRTFEVDAVRLSYRHHGDPEGPPFVLLHGSGSDATTWDRFALRLTRAGYHAVALDLRGHANSARTADYCLNSIRDDVLHLLDAASLHGVTLVGHSVGAYAALAAALHSPERITRLVLEDLAAPPQRAAPTSATALLRAMAAAAGILTQRRDYQLRAAVSIIRQLTRPDPGWWTRLGDVQQPALVLSGGATSCIPPQRLAAVADALPAARLTTIPVGHRVHSLAPDRFAAEVLTFLTESIRAPHGAGIPRALP